MEQDFELVLWPEVQEFMDEPWFRDEAVLDTDCLYGDSAYLIPKQRLREFNTKKILHVMSEKKSLFIYPKFLDDKKTCDVVNGLIRDAVLNYLNDEDICVEEHRSENKIIRVAYDEDSANHTLTLIFTQHVPKNYK